MIWLIGSGNLALEYAKVLKALSLKYKVIGRGKKSARKFTSITGQKVFLGGLSNFLDSNPFCAKMAIVCVGVEELASVSKELINFGVKKILLEKPGGINFEEVSNLNKFVNKKKVNVKIAYNRRFYSSVIKVKELIKSDGGLQSFNFDFTEWIHVIEKLNKSKKVLKNLFFLNSTHVVDLAFYLGGKPKLLDSHLSKKTTWNKKPAIFCGSGETLNGSLFNFSANWQSAGRWSIELFTARGKYILCPLEKLFFQKKGTIEVNEIKLDYKLDNKFKPGLFQQVKTFVGKTDKDLISLSTHCSMFPIYKKICSK